MRFAGLSASYSLQRPVMAGSGLMGCRVIVRRSVDRERPDSTQLRQSYLFL